MIREFHKNCLKWSAKVDPQIAILESVIRTLLLRENENFLSVLNGFQLPKIVSDVRVRLKENMRHAK